MHSYLINLIWYECIPMWSLSLQEMHSDMTPFDFSSALQCDLQQFLECNPIRSSSFSKMHSKVVAPYKKFPHVHLKTCLNLRHVSIHLFELGFYIDFMLGYVWQCSVDNVNLTHRDPVHVLVTEKCAFELLNKTWPENNWKINLLSFYGNVWTSLKKFFRRIFNRIGQY